MNYRPGRSITVGYTAALSFGGGPSQRDRVVVHAARRSIVGSDPVAEDGWGHPVYVFPAAWDPALPGLARALDPAALSSLFADLGIGQPGATVMPRLRSHRPMRRAVVEVAGPGGRLYLKVVPPAKAQVLHDRHRMLAAHVPVPPSLGWSDDGIVVLGAMAGRTMRAVLLGKVAVPALGAIEAVLDRLPSALVELPGAVGTLERVAAHVELLSAVVPELADRLAAFAEAVAPFADHDPGPLVAHHGDLYEGQLMVDGGRITGLLDVDGAGEGYRVDDLANLLGHLSLLGRVTGSTRCDRIGARWIGELDAAGGHRPSALRARVAAVVLGLATGCFRVQEAGWVRGTHRRVALAEEWLASARRAAARERGLTSISG